MLSARFVLSLALTMALVAPALSEEVPLPLRKGGQWELKTVMDEGGGPREQVLELCIDDQMEASTAAASTMEHKNNCKQYEVKKDGDKTVVMADCEFGMQMVQSITEMSGDFKTAFEVKIVSATRNADARRKQSPVPIKRTITQTGRYMSETCKDLQPGEARAPDGSKIMVQ